MASSPKKYLRKLAKMSKEIKAIDAFRALLRNSENAEGFYLAAIRAAWPKLFGKNVARQTRELKVRKGKLYVYVNTATMRSQLMMVREGIKQRLNEEIGEAYLNEVIVK